MGTWGTDIFSNDLSCDVRDAYKYLLESGCSGHEATKLIIKEYREEIEKYPESAGDFWLALAKVQSQYGRLENHVKAKALEFIENQTDLKNWEELGADSKLITKRAQKLEKFKIHLESPQPKEKKVRKKFRIYDVWEIGDIISFQLKSGNFCLFRIADYHQSDDLCCYCELLDWTGSVLPSDIELNQFFPCIIQPPDEQNYRLAETKRFLLVFENKKDLDDKRLNIVMRNSQPVTSNDDGCVLIMWPFLENLLNQFCGYQ